MQNSPSPAEKAREDLDVAESVWTEHAGALTPVQRAALCRVLETLSETVDTGQRITVGLPPGDPRQLDVLWTDRTPRSIEMQVSVGRDPAAGLAYQSEILKIVRFGLAGNSAGVRSYAELLVSKLEAELPGSGARLQEALDGREGERVYPADHGGADDTALQQSGEGDSTNQQRA